MLKYVIGFLVLSIFLAILTNPFSRVSIVRPTYKARFKDGKLSVRNLNHKLAIRQGWLFKAFAYLKSGYYVLETRYIRSRKSYSKSVSGIIADIHWLRFNPRKLLLISGDHFNSLFIRNLGVFYYPMVDTAIPSKPIDWQHRQIVYLQTVAFALGVWSKTDKLTTTIAPVGNRSVSCINFYAYPSDSLFGVLYALASLMGVETGRPYDYPASTKLKLQTVDEARKMLEIHREDLVRHYRAYQQKAFDESTGLVSAKLHMSGAKDITRRQSSFYDNVIFWKTTALAYDLGLIDRDEKFLPLLKKRIIKAFWLEKDGYFLEDLSQDGLRDKYYSSDWLAVLWTGFMDPSVKSERKYFTESLKYIDKMAIARPMAIKYQHETRASRQFFVVRMAVASYGGDSIWSFWGMEYIKLNLRLYQLTGDASYLKEADFQIEAYQKAMQRYGGFPEVYDASANLLKTPFYQSILMTGWVIGFEQVLAIRKSIS